MSSYYNRVIGTLEPSEVAKSEDIHLIQSSIQNALQSMIIDIFGPGCILGEEKESLKVMPTPYVIDQSNIDVEEEDEISFYDIYLRQAIDITKSEIQSITIQVKNLSQLEPTVFAEIRDSDFNLVKESNAKIPSTLNIDGFTNLEFVFNLQHLPVGEYYFVICPIDINSADLSINGDESYLDYIDETTFTVKIDKTGNYIEGLDASYNGVDFLESRLLDSNVKIVGEDIIEIEDNNFDLCFTHQFSTGNTYIIDNPAPCIVLGEKIYPIDTHVSIDGPSPSGNRIDLITLSPDGELNVTKGIPFSGTATEKDYPINTSGFKIAYITTYLESQNTWVCPTCGTVNNGNITHCDDCGTLTNTKIPLIEQADDNGITRRRDILERLRRLEKKMDYQTEYNSPSRIKYICTTDPTMAIKSNKKEDGSVYAEGTYNMNASTNANGESVLVATDNTSTQDYTWSIVNSVYEVTATEVSKIEVTSQDVHIPVEKPKTIDKDKSYIRIEAINQATRKAVAQLPIKITIQSITTNTKTKKTTTKTIQNYEKTTNNKGIIYIDPWSLKLKKGTYKIIVKYRTQTASIENNFIVDANKTFKAKINKKKMTINVQEAVQKTKNKNVDKNTITGDDSFYKDNITVDTDSGEVYITKKKNTDEQQSTELLSNNQMVKLNYSKQQYTINPSANSLQSQYPMLNMTFEKDCYLETIQVPIEAMSNIKKITVLLFKNDRVFNLNTNRTSYVKLLDDNAAKGTEFKNIYKKTVTPSTNTTTKTTKQTFTVNQNIKKGTYSFLIYAELNDKKQKGTLTLTEYHTSNITKYGAITRVKGTSKPQKVYVEGNSLINRTLNIHFKKRDDIHNTAGTIISKSIDTVDNILSCKIQHNYEIPAGCYIQTYVSNNGGRTYVQQQNDGTITFNGSGHELKWRLVFTGNGTDTPKLIFTDKTKYALKLTVTTGITNIGYEDYQRCFSTPILNANSITRLLAKNSNIKNAFEEWEYARLWMEDEDLQAKIDICFAYAYDNYKVSVTTPIESWGKDIFFSQVFCDMTAKDFSKTSVDYDNYNANVEPDELNFRFNLQTDYTYNLSAGEIVASPQYVKGSANYSYGDITNEDTDMSMFEYGLMDITTTYYDNKDEDQNVIISDMHAGMHILTAPYYQVKYAPEDDTVWANIPTDSTTGKMGDSNYDPSTCIIGISFDNGLEIKDQYTNLTLGMFPNLRDCQETDTDNGILDLSSGKIIRTGVKNESKYYDVLNRAYIPANTLEIVVALNPWGLIDDDNAISGIALPITQDLVSCEYTKVSIDLSELYGHTIYSIGIRINKNAVSEYDETNHVTKYKGLQQNDIIGISNLTFKGGNIISYTNWMEGDTKMGWKARNENQYSTVAIQYQLQKLDNEHQTTYNRYSQMILDKGSKITSTEYSPIYSKNGTILTNTNKIINTEVRDGNTIITTLKNDDTTYTNNPGALNDFVFDIASTETGKLFELPFDANLTVYDYICVSYYVEQTASEHTNGTSNVINKGDIILQLYDTTDVHENTTPVQELVLPAWGKIQAQSTATNKQVRSWFKIRNHDANIKKIVLARDDPTGSKNPIKIHIDGVYFYNASEIPALGPQMSMRIYPNVMNGVSNTKIRKFGGIYRLG